MNLSIKGLTKAFGEKKIITDFNFDFPERGLFVLLGESGVGKTTLLRMISGLDTDYSGEISGGGFNNVSFAFQEYRLIPTLSALDNIIYAVADKKTAQTEKCALATLLELGFSPADTALMPDELSGGMKQRVSLARAFMKMVPILLLDEPTKELDADNCTLVIKKISEIARERLVIVVTHKPEELTPYAQGTIILEKAVR